MQQELEVVQLPMLPLRGLNIFPEMLMTFDVERSLSKAALNNALKHNSIIFLTAQSDITAEEPELKDIYPIGTVCRIRQQLKQPRGSICKVMVEGLYRAQIVSVDRAKSGEYLASVIGLSDKKERVSSNKMEALLRNCVNLFEEYLQSVPDAVNEQILNVIANPSPAYVTSYIAQNLRIDVTEKQKILEELAPSRRLLLLSRLLTKEIKVLTIEKELNDKTQESVNKEQREYYLREEMKTIRSELGEEDDQAELDEYRAKIEKLAISDESREKLLKEVKRLSKQPFGSSEAAVLKNYLDTCLEIPWGVFDEETLSPAKARKVLDDEHYGLEDVKERIVEYLSVRKISENVKGGLICLVGPPGTGKTSIAMSVAHAMNRKLVRVALGGIHDEAEIRGHRKTYIGAMPGRIINGIIQAKTCNPVMVLDEVDKLGSDYKGDPSSALLEVLDGEQNHAFRDHFIEIPFDLSQVFFICTANSRDTIPRPLLDRMEVIEVSSYTDEEKLQIAKRHLLPKQRTKHGLKPAQLKISDDGIRFLIRAYTRESGVRNLERELAALCRKAAKGIACDEFKSLSVTPSRLEKILGPVKFKDDEKRTKPEIGVVRGLAYTSVGGEVLDVEVAVIPGKGKLELTGNLGNVMKESVSAAMTYIRSRADRLGLDPEFYNKNDIHVHFPEAAVPKDGPSAGITICMAIISALTQTPVNQDVCMTGEISLRGNIMAIGGLREKTMAAYRNGMKIVIIPKDNLTDLEKIDQTVRQNLTFIPATHADDVFDIIFTENPLKQRNEQKLAAKPNTAVPSEVRA